MVDVLRIHFDTNVIFYLSKGKVRRSGNFILMLSTGKVDAHGKEVFEGDVVSDSCSYDDRDIAIVKYDENSESFFIHYIYENYVTSDIDFSSLSVVGNVYSDRYFLDILYDDWCGVILLKYQKEVIIYLKLMNLLKIYLKAKIKSLTKLIVKLIKLFIGR